jgi:Icc protein
VLSWLHIGDLHVTGPDEQNLIDLRRLIGLANGLPPGSLDFAVLPGDNADYGTEGQFKPVRDAVATLHLELHILPGDHDFKPRNLEAFYCALGGERLPYAITARGHRCLFRDVVSAGTGGPDFRLDTAQLDWVEQQLEQAESAVVFVHTYPADLREGAGRLNALLARPQVRCVDMRQTHYNELANDGGTISMATRSTGQIEEGPPGFSVAAIDGDCVSWRFKPLDQAWPFVLVTQPADQRLVTQPTQMVNGALVVPAKVLGDVPI